MQNRITKNILTKIKKVNIWTIIKYIVAIGLFAYVLSLTSIGDIIYLKDRISFAWFFSIVFSFFGLTFTMSRRYWLLINKITPFQNVVSSVIYQTVLGNLFATSVGSISFITLLKGKHQVSIGRSVSSLIFSKLSDLPIISLGLLLSSWVLWQNIVVLHWTIIISLSIILLIMLILASGFLGCVNIVPLIHSIFLWSGLIKLHWVEKIWNFSTNVIYEHKKDFLPFFKEVAIYSCLIFFFSFIYSYSNMKLFNIPLGIWPILFIFFITQFMSLVPIYVLGGIGVMDITSVFLFGLFGLAPTEIAPLVIGLRIVFYGVNFLLLLYIIFEGLIIRFTNTSNKSDINQI